MSKNINVNPGQYKVAGRERQGEDIVQSAHKQADKIAHQEEKTGRRPAKKSNAAKARRHA